MVQMRDPQPLVVRLTALKMAMYNVRHMYTWVGVLERFEESLMLLVRLLPSYFSELQTFEVSCASVLPLPRSHAAVEATCSIQPYSCFTRSSDLDT